jgi:ABC-type phosphate transport system permease subunit
MNIIVFQLINYTLSFLMWMILGRVVVTLITAGKQNFIIGMFQKVTDPVYRTVRAIFPFMDVPPEKRGGMYEAIGGCVPFVSIFLVIVLRLGLSIFLGPEVPKK